MANTFLRLPPDPESPMASGLNKWLVQVFGDPNGESWEISVVRESNHHGRNSWGWFDENKLLISHNGGPCRWPLAPGLGDRMVRLAQEYADELNALSPGR